MVALAALCPLAATAADHLDTVAVIADPAADIGAAAVAQLWRTHTES
jgi:hypothetical protein